MDGNSINKRANKKNGMTPIHLRHVSDVFFLLVFGAERVISVMVQHLRAWKLGVRPCLGQGLTIFREII